LQLLGHAEIRHNALHATHGEGQVELEVLHELLGAVGVGSEVRGLVGTERTIEEALRNDEVYCLIRGQVGEEGEGLCGVEGYRTKLLSPVEEVS